MRVIFIRKHACVILLAGLCQQLHTGSVAHAQEPLPAAVENQPQLNQPQLVAAPPVETEQKANIGAECLLPSQYNDVVPRIDAVSLDVLQRPGELPKTCFSQLRSTADSVTPNNCRWQECNDYHWAASELCSQPLYFEDVSVERYGRTSCVQSFCSGAKFFGSIAILPYKIGVDPACVPIYTLGYERPGNCAPAVCEQLPFSVRGTVLQTGAVTGVGALFP